MARQLDRWLPAEASPQSGAPAESFVSVRLDDVFTPHPGPQLQFFESTCREILYGGAAGGGKSFAVSALPLVWAHIPGFLALTLRRTKPQARDLQSKSRKLYRKAFPGLRPVRTPQYTWTFPSGAQSVYGHCNNLDDWEQYQGWEVNLLCFDELTTFTEQQYLEICARLRSAEAAAGLPTLIRATSNPGGDGHEWVFRRWGAWLDPNFEAAGLPPKSDRPQGNPPAEPGEVWWIRTVDGVETYFRQEPANDGGPPALSRTFIPAKLEDNPSLALGDPSYAAQLESLDAVRRAQLRDGDWLAKPAAGLHFQRGWCELVEPSDVPRDAQVVRHWDLAATEEPKLGGASGDPDWTVGIKMARKGPTYWIVDMVRFRKGSGGVDDAQRSTAEADGARCVISMFQDPGQAGKDQVRHKAALLNGFRLKVARETGDIVTRFGPFSSQAEHHNVRIVRGSWNRALWDELEAFPDATHDDIAAAVAGAYNGLTGGGQQGFGDAGHSRSGERAA